ncbi:SH3 domain-containing protein [Mariprofundus sp. NF]|uniref:SH3 domain-containing protein n=1 Tax=Mariprofundus sp. NF TaxID=2608716 RepID=UPI0015A3CD68
MTKKPLQPVLEKRVVSIEIAKVETNKSLMIQQVNPVILAMGSTGLLLDTGMLIFRASKYRDSAGPVNQMCNETFEKSLLKALSQKGIQTKSSKRAYWDYYRGKQKQLTKTIDTILKVELRNVGFWSKGPLDPYRPSIFVLAELIEPSTRKVLYSDRFTMGIDITSLQVMKYLFGDINILPEFREAKSYKTFSKLINSPEQSREALLKVVEAAASHLAKGLNGEKEFITNTYAKSSAQILMATTDNMVIDVEHAAMRKSPNSKSRILQKLNKGNVVTRMQKQGEWVFVRLQDRSTAWAHQSMFVDEHGIISAETNISKTTSETKTSQPSPAMVQAHSDVQVFESL